MTARIDRGVGRAIGAAALSGVLGFAADYPHPIPALLLIAPLPVLVAILRSSAAWAAVLGLVWGLVQRADMWRVMSGLGVPLPIAVGLVAAAVATAPKAPAKTVRVAAVSLRLPPEIDARWARREVRSEDTWAVLARLEGLARRAAADGARVVVWPEYGVFVG